MRSIVTDRYPALKALGELEMEEVQGPMTDQNISELESKLGVLLPNSYKSFLKVCSGFWLYGGAVKLGPQHLFFHDFPSSKNLSSQQLNAIKRKGGNWPPPSNGMLCFGDYFLEADGDQVLFKVDEGLIESEYPVYYYSHEDTPASIRKVSSTFEEWMQSYCIQEMSKE